MHQAPPSSDDEIYYTTREAADKLHVSLRTIQLWVESGILKAWKTSGGHRRIPQSAINELLRRRQGEIEGSSPPANSLFSILILEEDDRIIELYHAALADWDLPLKAGFTRNPYEALILIGRSRPDLFITDLKMAGVDGFEMIRQLRSDSELNDLHIISISELAADEIAERGGLPEDITLFGKPIAFDQLFGYISACVALQKNRVRDASSS